MNQSRIDIANLTVAEKVGLMKLLWRDLAREPENIDVPEWHLSILEERAKALADGEDEFIDFDDAIAEIRGEIGARRGK